MFFRTFCFVLILVFLNTTIIAQDKASFDPQAGIENFVLGASRESFGNSIRFSDSMTWKGIKEYTYVHSFPVPYELAGVKFLDVLLIFDAASKLKEVQLTKIYTKLLFEDPAAAAKKDRDSLYAFIRQKAGEKGKKRKFSMVEAQGYEWKNSTTLLWIYLQPTEHTLDHTYHYSISIIWKYK